MENRKSTALRDEIFSNIATNTGYIKNIYLLMESCNTLINYSYSSSKRFKKYFVNKIYNRINRENKIANWEDIYIEELTLLEEGCSKYKNIIQQCLKWDGKLTLLIISSLCMVMISIFLIVWTKSTNGYILFVVGAILMFISVFPHYNAKRLIKRRNTIKEFIEKDTVDQVEKIVEHSNKIISQKILTPLLYVLHLLEEKGYIVAHNKYSFLYKLYLRYKPTKMGNENIRIEAKEFFILLTVLISSKKAEGKKSQEEKNSIAIFNLKLSQKEVYNFVYDVFNKDRVSSVDSYKTELSSGLNRILSKSKNELILIDKKYKSDLLGNIINKINS